MKNLSILVIAFAFASAPSIVRADNGSGTVSIRVVNHVCDGNASVTVNSSSFGTDDNTSNFTTMLSNCSDVTAPQDGTNVTVRVHGTGGVKTDIASDGFVTSRVCAGESAEDSSDADQSCYDASYYDFKNVPQGSVTLIETGGRKDMGFGMVGFDPLTRHSGDLPALISFGPDVVNLDTGTEGNGVVTVHVFNVANANGADGTDGAAGAQGADGIDGASSLSSSSVVSTASASADADLDGISHMLDRLKSMVMNLKEDLF